MKDHSLRSILEVVGMLILAGYHKLEARTNIELNGSDDLWMGAGFSAEERANLEKQNSNP